MCPALPKAAPRSELNAVNARGTILVTGGAGFVGSHVAKALAQNCWLPVVYDNFSNGQREAVRWGPVEEGDLRDRARLTEALTRHRPGAVIHLAGLIEAGFSVADPLSFHEVNVGGTLALLAAMAETGVATLIYSSTAAVYGRLERLPADESHPVAPITPYGRSKAMVETIIEDHGRATGFRWCTLRYFNAAGADPAGELGESHTPETHLIPLAIEAALGRRPALSIYGSDYETEDGTCIRDFVHVSDLSAAHIMALDYLMGGGAPAALNLGSGKGYSVRQVLTAVEKAVGRPVPAIIQPPRAGDPPVLISDNSRAARILGWRAEKDLDQIVADAVRWIRRPR